MHRLLIVLSCTVLTEVGELEKLGAPVAVDEIAAAAPAAVAGSAANSAVQKPATNLYGQGQQPQQFQQQARPSQYVLLYAITNSSGNITVYPIEGLSPYQNKLPIKSAYR